MCFPRRQVWMKDTKCQAIPESLINKSIDWASMRALLQGHCYRSQEGFNGEKPSRHAEFLRDKMGKFRLQLNK